MVLNTPLSHKYSIYHFNTGVCKDPSDYRSSRPEVFCKKSLLKNFTKFTGKHQCQSLFFNKVACLRPVTVLKKRLWHRCFPVNFAKVLRTSFLQNTSGRLLLIILSTLHSYMHCIVVLVSGSHIIYKFV